MPPKKKKTKEEVEADNKKKEEEKERKKQEKKEKKWAKSKAKAILRQGILDGSLLGIEPETVYKMDAEHSKWKFTNWKNNFENLQNAIARDRDRMVRDVRAYGRDKKIVLTHLRTTDDVQPWHKTECPKLLKKDIDNELHLNQRPEEIYHSRSEYQAFPLTIFRKHVYQEIDSRPKRAIRFEKKRLRWKYPELHKDHPRLKGEEEE